MPVQPVRSQDAGVTPETSGRIAFAKLASDSVKNIIFFGIGAAVVMAIGSYVRWLGLLLWGIDALITLLQTAITVSSALLGVVVFVAKAIRLRYKMDDAWWDLANLVQLIEGGVHVLYFLILYRFFFPA